MPWAAAGLPAQAYDRVFAGTSLAGSADPHFVAAGTSGVLLSSANSSSTDNVSGAAWLDGGARLVVSRTLQPGLSVGSWSGTALQWAPLYTSNGSCYGLGVDARRGRIWTLVTGGGNSELECIDADPASGTYGTMLARTFTLSGPIRENWALAPNGNFAVVPHGMLQAGVVDIVDTDPSRATFGSIVASVPCPGAMNAFSFAFDVAITPDDQHALILYAGVGYTALAVLQVSTLTWLDFDAVTVGQQDLTTNWIAGSDLDLARSGQFALLSGVGSTTGAGSGWVARVDFDWSNPANSTLAQLPLPANLTTRCSAVAIAADATHAVFSSTPGQLVGPSYLRFVDLTTAAVTHSTSLPNAWNVYTLAWQDGGYPAEYTPFGTACPGALGSPNLQAAQGSLPRLSSQFVTEVSGLPTNLALLATGLSRDSSNGIPLPFSLSSLGMPQCSLLVDPALVQLLVGSVGMASRAWTLPADRAFLGLLFYEQAFVIDPSANATGLTTSQGAVLRLGW